MSADTLVFAPGHEPPAGQTRPKSARRQRHVVSVANVALALPDAAWQQIAWRVDGHGRALRRALGARAGRLGPPPPHAAEWLMIEWPEGEAAPIRYWLSALPRTPVSRVWWR